MANKLKVMAKFLADTIGFVKPFVDGASPHPAWRRVAHMEDRRVIVGQDGVIGAACETPLPKGTASASFDGVRLGDLAALIGDAEASLDVQAERIVLESGGTRGTFSFAVEESPFPTWPGKKLAEAPAGLLAALRGVQFSADQSGRAGVLAAVFVSKDGAFSTDGSRATRFALGSVPSEPAIVPGRLLTALSEAFVPEEWGVVDGRFWLRAGSRLAWTNLMEPPYPDLLSVFQRARAEARKASVAAFDQSAFLGAIDKIMTAGVAEVSGTFAGGTLLMESVGDHTTVRAQVKALLCRGDGGFRVNAVKLRDAVQRFPRVAFCGAELLYFAADDGRAEHVLMGIVR